MDHCLNVLTSREPNLPSVFFSNRYLNVRLQNTLYTIKPQWGSILTLIITITKLLNLIGYQLP